MYKREEGRKEGRKKRKSYNESQHFTPYHGKPQQDQLAMTRYTLGNNWIISWIYLSGYISLCVWVSMSIYEYLWVFMSICEYLWVCIWVNNNDIKTILFPSLPFLPSFPPLPSFFPSFLPSFPPFLIFSPFLPSWMNIYV